MQFKTYAEKATVVLNWLRRPMSRAFLKAFFFTLLLLWIQSSGYGVFPLFLFICFSVYIFATPIARKFSGPITFLTLVSLSLLLPSRFTLMTPNLSHIFPGQVFAIVFGALCFMYVCVVCKAVSRTNRLYEIMHAGLLWGTSLLFITGQDGSHPVRTLIIGAILFFALTAEYLTQHGHSHRRVIRLSSMLLTLLLTEFAWGLRLLPLSPGYSAAVLTLLGVIGTSALEQYGRGTLRAHFVRYSLLVVLSVSILIALLTDWTI
jgi:hypothetical protein